jgi:membrane-associated phospholipid phosphatase
MCKAIMCRSLRAGVILLLLLGNRSAYSQLQRIGPQGPEPSSSEGVKPGLMEDQREDSPRVFLKDVWHDQKAIWTSPFRMNRRQWLGIALPLAAGTAALIATDKDATKWLPNTPDQIRWSNRVSRTGALYTLGAVTGGTLLVGKETGRPEVFHTGRVMSEALVDSIIVNYGVKFATGRERPLENSGQGHFWKGGDAFPSGHAMHSWAVAMALARNPHTPKWLKITSVGLSTGVSLSRWGAQKHFPSDVLVGGVFGGLIGNFVATRPR